MQLVHLHSTIFILKPLTFDLLFIIALRFTFYYIYIKTAISERIIQYNVNLHSTIFILKPSAIAPFNMSVSNLHSTIFILKQNLSHPKSKVL